MSLVPKCTFEVRLAQGALFAGTRNEGALWLHVPAPIPRAEEITLDFATHAAAGYGSGKSRSVVQRRLFQASYRLALPGSLAPGVHPVPFVLDVPAWVPPAFHAQDCRLWHSFEARLDVDWALDATASFEPLVVPPTSDARREPLTRRSPPQFLGELVLEITLPSSVLVLGEPLEGAIAIRAGHDTRFDAIELDYASFARVRMGSGDTRPCAPTSTVRIPADAPRAGRSVPFRIIPDRAFLPTLRNSFLDHELCLVVRADVPWAVDPSFDVPLLVLGVGSALHGEKAAPVVGSERVRRMAATMAQGAELTEGRLPVLAHGAVGPVHVAIEDAPRAGGLGIDVNFVFPDLELGADFKPRGALQTLRGSPLLPPGLEAYFLRTDRDDPALAVFFERVLGKLHSARDVRFSDHHLGFHVPLPGDEPQRMVLLARAAKDRARAIGDAIAQLAFPAPLALARPAWGRTAFEQNASLVPSGPALHGLVFRARVLGGEERAVRVTLRTVGACEAPTCRADVDLGGMALPVKAVAGFGRQADPELLRGTRALFPAIELQADGRSATLQGAAWPADPRMVLPAIEAFFFWALVARGEHRSDAPYR